MCNNIAKIRKNKGLTQKELALKLGSSQQFISDIENMKVMPSLTMAFKIKNILGVSLEEIFYIC
ncbi:UNVERIFIED_CONTAM: helix-turn-helix transcriptional regulator [Streptococcus canis]|uniref:helix-turn-helix transcriptional regulator n=1 Tax=Streptococcus canis TaxID=1329 RepID=UPI002F964EE8